jgi:hypothetical protein
MAAVAIGVLIPMLKGFLNRADIIAVLKQIRGKRMPESVWSCGFCQPGLASNLLAF